MVSVHRRAGRQPAGDDRRGGSNQVNALAAELARSLDPLVDNLVLFETVDSTHLVALRLIDQVDVEGLVLRPTVVIADAQRIGVGRGGRRWVSPPGGLYLSWLSSAVSDHVVARLPMLAAAAACLALADAGVDEAGIKWPNDLLVDDRKLAGILVHCRRGTVNRVTVSLGVNVVPIIAPVEGASRPPISLAEVIGAEAATPARTGVAVGFVRRLVEAIADPAPALERWRRRLVHRTGDQISVRTAAGAIETGTFAGLTDEGFLRLGQGPGERVISGGDVVES
ncbi:MAG: biotin--[acetyl-CoA-carboxylase] ligase [Holophagae bacterium]|nr:MAG: biotin--[acetyl-CoA-carboxylase] ligase [Holophagae bacterium]